MTAESQLTPYLYLAPNLNVGEYAPWLAETGTGGVPVTVPVVFTGVPVLYWDTALFLLRTDGNFPDPVPK